MRGRGGTLWAHIGRRWPLNALEEWDPPHNLMQLRDATDLNRVWRRRLRRLIYTLKNSIGIANLARGGLEVPITQPRQSEHRKRLRNPSFPHRLLPASPSRVA